MRIDSLNELPQSAPTSTGPELETPLDLDAAESLPALAAEPSAPVAPQPVRLEVSALSDIGCVRSNNEDAFGFNDAAGIYVVCDGMGGMASGEIASARAASTIVEVFIDSAASGAPISTRLLQAIDAANRTVWTQGQVREHKGMGTTAVAAALDGDKLLIGNVGDSRAYMVQDGQCMQLTVDHSYVNELIRNGTLTVENAHNANLRGLESVITRAIGAASEVQPDFFSVDLTPGTAVLLATDGLTRYVTQEELAQVLVGSPFEATCATLIDLAKLRGGQDNITCMLLRVVQSA